MFKIALVCIYFSNQTKFCGKFLNISLPKYEYVHDFGEERVIVKTSLLYLIDRELH